MTEDMQALRDDIAYLKGLADSGQARAPTGGILLIAAGLLYSAASAIQWAAMKGLLPGVATLAWLVATVAFMAILVAVKLHWRSEKSSPGTMGYAWQGVGMGCFFIFAALAVATWRTQNPLLIQFAPSIIFTLYGAAWIVAATVMRRLWLHFTAWGSFLAAVVVAWFIGDPASYLIYAGGLILLALVPGVIFLLQARGQGE